MAADLVIENGTLNWAGPTGTRSDLPGGPDLNRAMIWPCPVDCHTHLYKGQVWLRGQNPDGTFGGAILAAREDRARFQTRADIRRRAEFQLRSAHAHGTCAVRGHVDGDPDIFDDMFEELGDLADAWCDGITLQLCPFGSSDDDPDWIEHLAAAAARRSPGVLILFVQDRPGGSDFLDHAFMRAGRSIDTTPPDHSELHDLEGMAP